MDGLGEELLNLGRVVDIVSKAGCGCLGSGVIFQDHWLHQRLCGRSLGVRRHLLCCPIVSSVPSGVVRPLISGVGGPRFARPGPVKNMLCAATTAGLFISARLRSY